MCSCISHYWPFHPSKSSASLSYGLHTPHDNQCPYRCLPGLRPHLSQDVQRKYFIVFLIHRQTNHTYVFVFYVHITPFVVSTQRHHQCYYYCCETESTTQSQFITVSKSQSVHVTKTQQNEPDSMNRRQQRKQRKKRKRKRKIQETFLHYWQLPWGVCVCVLHIKPFFYSSKSSTPSVRTDSSP